jgi:hypothetical protein
VSEYQFGPADVESLANALSQRTGHRLMTDWVEIEKTGWAGERLITVMQEDVMAKVRPYVDDPTWASIHDPMLYGYRLTGARYYNQLTQQAQYIGMSTSGKSSLLQNIIAYVTRCANARLWIGGIGKLYDLVAEWCECYMGLEFPIPIDWIATGPQDTLEMMTAALRIAHYRQNAPIAQQVDWPVLIVILDEVTDIAEDDTHWIVYEGQRMFGTDLLAKLARRAASGNVFIKLATQRDTNDMFGDKGGSTTAQLLETAAFMSQDRGSLGRLMDDDYSLPMPRHRGVCWLKPGNGDLPLQLKVPYLQPASRGKKRLHNGITIPEVAWSRRHFHSSFDPGSIGAAGKAYARRFTHMTPEFQNYLRGIEDGGSGAVSTAPVPRPTPLLVTVESDPDSVSDADRAMAEALALAESLGVELPDDLVSERDRLLTARASAVQAQPAEVVSMVGRKPRIDRIAEFMAANPGATRAQVIAELKSQGDHKAAENPGLVSNDLGTLVRRGRLIRDGEGYRAL